MNGEQLKNIAIEVWDRDTYTHTYTHTKPGMYWPSEPDMKMPAYTKV